MLKFHRLHGEEARAFVHDLAELRLKVFWDFPYLYEGTPDYEKKYLETYFKARHSFIFLVEDHQQIVGASTGIWAREEEESFNRPFVDKGLNPAEIFYFGESVLLPDYRGRGLGKVFFEEREAFARSLPFIKALSFCAVVRSSEHPLMPAGYRPLDSFWESQGFRKVPDLMTTYHWQDRGESVETAKDMQFWMKQIR